MQEGVCCLSITRVFPCLHLSPLPGLDREEVPAHLKDSLLQEQERLAFRKAGYPESIPKPSVGAIKFCSFLLAFCHPQHL